MDHILSTMTCPSWAALHSMTHSFFATLQGTELKAMYAHDPLSLLKKRHYFVHGVACPCMGSQRVGPDWVTKQDTWARWLREWFNILNCLLPLAFGLKKPQGGALQGTWPWESKLQTQSIGICSCLSIYRTTITKARCLFKKQVICFLKMFAFLMSKLFISCLLYLVCLVF